MNYRLLFNLFVSIIAAFVLVVLILISIFSNVEKRKTAYYFLWALVSALIPVGVLIACYAVRLSPHTSPVLIRALGGSLFIFMYAAAYGFLLYCLSFIGMGRRINKAVVIILAIIGIGFSIMMVVSAVTDMFFTIHADGVIILAKKDLSFLPYIYLWITFFVELLLLIIKKGMIYL